MNFNFGRRRSLFDQPQEGFQYPPFDFNQAATDQGQNVVDNPLESQPSPTSGSRFSQVYADLADEKGGPAQQKYTNFLDTGPKREDYKPGKLNRLAAILGGISEGQLHGGAAGYKTSTGILDDSYNEAQKDWSTQADKLKEASGIEEKDMGRRVGILKDIIQEDRNRQSLDEIRNYHQGRLKNDADANKTRGIQYSDITDPTTGMKATYKLFPDGRREKIDLGKGAQTVDEKVDEAKKKYGATVPDRMKVQAAGIAARGDEARNTLAARLKGVKDIIKYKQENPTSSYDWKNDPNSGMIVGINRHDPNDVVMTSIEHGKLTEEEKASLGLKNAKDLKAAPGPSKDKVIKRDRDGKVIQETTTQGEAAGKEEDLSKKAPPAGAKKGKWTKLRSGRVIWTEEQ
jgi:hypothetical protein